MPPVVKPRRRAALLKKVQTVSLPADPLLAILQAGAKCADPLIRGWFLALAAGREVAAGPPSIEPTRAADAAAAKLAAAGC